VSSVAGRKADAGAAIYNLTKFGVNGFTESLRQELTANHVRVGAIEPGAVLTELPKHNTPEVQAGMASMYVDIEAMAAEDIAEAIASMVSQPRRVAINEMLVRPTGQIS
jgi:NADP-dependent 3-hydroxy acid dehydrogenase YdfG